MAEPVVISDYCKDADSAVKADGCGVAAVAEDTKPDVAAEAGGADAGREFPQSKIPNIVL